MKLCPALLTCLGVILPACGPDPVAPAELEEVCGAPSPFRVLELAPDEVVVYQSQLTQDRFSNSQILQVQDRVFYVVRRIDPSDPNYVYGVLTPEVESTVWATGPCGESPVQVATGIEDLFTLDAWPDVVLGCDATTGNVMVLDPTGAQEPHIVFSGLSSGGIWGCALQWTEFGALSLDKHDDELSALVLHPYPADPRTETSVPVVLLDEVRHAPSRGSGLGNIHHLLYTYQDQAFALTSEGALVRVDLADRSVSTLQTGVAGFDVSRDAQHLVWQDATVTKSDPIDPEGKIFLRDLPEGSDTLLAETALGYGPGWPLMHAERGLVRLGFGNIFSGGAQRAFFLPELDSVDLPGNLSLNVQLADGRWIGTPIFTNDDYLELIDLPKGERKRLFPRLAQYAGREDDAVRVLEVPQCCIDSEVHTEGPLWRVPLDGSATTKLAERATRSATYLDDGRLLGPIDTTSNYLSSLVLVDTESRAESLIDSRVHFYSIDPSHVSDDGIVSYSVAGGDRPGVYLAKLPPAAQSRAAAPKRSDAFVVDLIPGPDGKPVPQLRAVDESPH